jgi:hypothetical protein
MMTLDMRSHLGTRHEKPLHPEPTLGKNIVNSAK